ncbi:LuxR C-terminal-related transcriptional regulator [Streptomyces somaliensis DSM 40738]|uniref:Helix-turn-helix transcriptional regulator n=1 Tax=Streptomyces somaliensis (strain ATCC 33201 / DSM 40738 / JCM 12659 / KCTC 9044 / NCTC 11332 / NRRL B-12077 / IP 733) TaxID=1134445 RepID=A0AA44ICY1_STRE0|nr:LuxR C-terminal-related transcriptional regulator [Streptomyces somaliensis]MCQ0021577.1 LuxR C-terminal-related transcriptional regulator [Streptomyces somaliensis DSM 40738]NKY14139.1 helix-turn-helix transcriptional regulator [Streptomyces somaliensis DSM 40738]
MLDIHEPPRRDEDHLADLDQRLYEYVVSTGACEVSDLPAELGVTTEAAGDSVRRLLALRLLRTEPGAEGRVSAVSPQSAAVLAALPVENRLRRQMEEVQRLRHRIEGLLPFYERGRGGGPGSDSLQALPELDDVLAVLAHQAATCREEVLTAQPGGRRNVDELAEAVERDEGILRRKVRMRTLYQHPARFHQATAAYAERLAQLGGEVRTTSANLMRLIVFDRKTALISHVDHPRGAVLVRDRSVVDFVVQAFEHIWLKADPFPVDHDRELIQSVSEDTDQTLLRLLVSGESDQAVARRLGVSMRTVQRRLGKISEELGATSRLQAGYLIHRRGLLPDN